MRVDNIGTGTSCRETAEPVRVGFSDATVVARRAVNLAEARTRCGSPRQRPAATSCSGRTLSPYGRPRSTSPRCTEPDRLPRATQRKSPRVGPLIDAPACPAWEPPCMQGRAPPSDERRSAPNTRGQSPPSLGVGPAHTGRTTQGCGDESQQIASW
jgi:hypothetical protein